MFRFALTPMKPLAVAMWLVGGPLGFCLGGAEPVATANPAQVHTFVIAFVGGFVHRDDARHPEVKLIQRLQADYPEKIVSRVFENRRNREAYELIRRQLDQNHDGSLSESEKESARIMLVGHSWGAFEVVSLARRLQRDGIPVLLTAQVDSVAKIGRNDSLIPANVQQAVNFYQTRGWIHGRAKITAADPSRTRILGNFQLSYREPPAECKAYPWYDLFFTRSHTEIECDPDVWSRIESLVRDQLTDRPAQKTSVFSISPIVSAGRKVTR